MKYGSPEAFRRALEVRLVDARPSQANRIEQAGGLDEPSEL